jgi:hypothetical protein
MSEDMRSYTSPQDIRRGAPRRPRTDRTYHDELAAARATPWPLRDDGARSPVRRGRDDGAAGVPLPLVVLAVLGLVLLGGLAACLSCRFVRPAAPGGGRLR